MNRIIVLILTMVISLGLGLAFGALLLFLVRVFPAVKNQALRFLPKRPEERRIAQKERGITPSDKRLLTSMGGGALLLGLLTWGSSLLTIALVVGVILGFVGDKVVKWLSKGSEEFEKVKEVALLYESIELYTRAGFTVRQSMQMSQILVSHLQPHISKCLDRWPSGPLRALQQLGDDIGVKHADLLTGILMQAEERGTKNVNGIMEQEAIRLEELRSSLAESRIAAKPIYSAVYLFLPVSSVMGILLAPMAYHAIQMISGMKAGGF
ncbi:MAG: hypothetical protein ACYCX4_03665 [Bacillota bacterium]